MQRQVVLGNEGMGTERGAGYVAEGFFKWDTVCVGQTQMFMQVFVHGC